MKKNNLNRGGLFEPFPFPSPSALSTLRGQQIAMQFYVSKYCSTLNSIYSKRGRVPQRRVLVALSNLIYIYGNACLPLAELDMQVQDLIYGSESSDYIPSGLSDKASRYDDEDIFRKLM